MENRVVLNTGFKTFDVEDTEGKYLFSFSFNPSDTNIVHRYTEVADSLEKISNEIPEEVDKTDLETGINYLDKLVYEKVDYLLNANVAESFFSVMGPFTPLENGNYFIESVMDTIAQVIQAETGERVKKINKKIKKHTSKYHA